jgi:hemerythrin-like domain-containing protein
MDTSSHAVGIWRQDHANFSKLLDILDGQLLLLQTDQDADYELIEDVIYYLQQYSDRYHHPREDIAFARLLERDAALQMPVNRLLQEHRVIREAGEQVRERLDQVLRDEVVTREWVETPLALYITFYRHHLAMEDSQLIPIAARMLTLQDWEAVDEAVPRSQDPLFGDTPHEQFSVLRSILVEAGTVAEV